MHTSLTIKLDNRLYDRLLDLARKTEQKPGTLAARALIDYLRTQDALAAKLLAEETDLARWEDESPSSAAATVPAGSHRWPG